MKIAGDIVAGRFGYGDDMGKFPRDALLHAAKRIPAPLLHFFPYGRSGSDGNFAIDGDGMVNGGNGGQPFFNGEQAI